MSWLKKVSEDKITFFTNVNENDTNFRVTIFNNTDNIKPKFTSLTQYFLISYKKQLDELGYDVVIHIKIPNADMYEQIIQEVALHFKSIELIQECENVTEVMLREPLESSLKQIEKLSINPIINDIFMREYNYKPLHPYHMERETFYEVDFSCIDFYENAEFDSVYDCICAVSSGKEDVIIYPKNWIVNDNLKESLAIRYFTNHWRTKGLYLKVDAKTNSVIYVHIKY